MASGVELNLNAALQHCELSIGVRIAQRHPERDKKAGERESIKTLPWILVSIFSPFD